MIELQSPQAGATTLRFALLTNHGHVLTLIAQQPDIRMREIAANVGITERAVQRIVDELTTLKPTSDRLFCTAVAAEWRYTVESLAFDAMRTALREAMLRTFANHKSKSVQETLYEMGKSALERVAEVDQIDVVMPNKHCLLVDLARFGQDNPNEIFVPTDEPAGQIEARVRRKA